jgi:hypothetical protein
MSVRDENGHKTLAASTTDQALAIIEGGEQVDRRRYAVACTLCDYRVVGHKRKPEILKTNGGD